MGINNFIWSSKTHTEEIISSHGSPTLGPRAGMAGRVTEYDSYLPEAARI